MRTRKSRKATKYSLPDYGLGSDGEAEQDTSQAQSPAADVEGEDEEFTIGPIDPALEDDEEFEDVPDDQASDDGVDGTRRSGLDRKSKPPPKRKAKHALATDDPTNLVAYPTDSRLTSTRLYHGIFQKLLRAYFYEDFYGPGEEAVAAAMRLFRRWATHEILPSKLLDENLCCIPTPWVADDFESVQTVTVRDWLQRYREATSQGFAGEQHILHVPEDTAQPYLIPSERHLTMLTSLADTDKQHPFSLHRPMPLHEIDASVGDENEDQDATSDGWIFDVGGLILSLAWAPMAGRQAQVLAVAISPFVDQDLDALQAAVTPADYQQHHGLVQLWSLEEVQPGDGPTEPLDHQPRLACTLLLEWGRAKKLLWCPAASSTLDDHIGLLGVMCAGGMVHIIRIDKTMLDGNNTYHIVENPVVSLGFTEEDHSVVTSFAWVGVNRVVTGHSDGSIALWSLFPRVCLLRHAVHHGHVLHLATGYPSHPHLVASHPVSGISSFLDLRDPSSEVTTTTNAAITPHHSMLVWCDHLQGFVSALPSSKPLNTAAGLFHSRTFSSTARKVIEGEALLSAIAVGAHHPFVLTALLDGSVWACNPIHRTFLPRHAPPGWKLKVFQHEHVPRARLGTADGAQHVPLSEPVQSSRGVSRIRRGFKPVPNHGPKALEFAANGSKPGSRSKRKVRGSTKKSGQNTAADEAGDGEDEGGIYADPTKLIVQEPLSRVMVMSWNPNRDYATWAAFGIASGLVRIQNLGVAH